jgi:hypothetical protein
MVFPSPRVIGHSPLHARQHHISRTTPRSMVVSGVTVLSAPHSLQTGGTVNRTGVVGTWGVSASVRPTSKLIGRYGVLIAFEQTGFV